MTSREKFIAIVDNDNIQKSDAIILLEGDGFNRYRKAVELYKEGYAEKIVFNGGITDYEYGSFPFSDILPKIIEDGVLKENIIHENNSKNTREQAVEIIKLAENYSWQKLILVATHEHQYRAYLTFLKVVLDSHLKIILYNAPVRNLGWFKETGWGKRIDRLEGEFKRIEEYTILGHLASFDEAIDYQSFKESQSN